MCFHPDSEMDQSTRVSGKGKIFKHLQISPVRLVQRYVPDGFQPSRLLQHFLIRHALACLIPDTAAVGEAEAGEDALHVGLQFGEKKFCQRPSEICCAHFDSKAVQKVPTKAAFHRHFPVARDCGAVLNDMCCEPVCCSSTNS